VGGFRFKVPGMFCRCPQRREMAADGADVQTVLIQRDGSFVTYSSADGCGRLHFFDELFGGIIGNVYLCTQLYY